MILKLLLLPALFAQVDFDIWESDFGPATVQGNRVVFTDVDLADHFVDTEGPRVSEAYLDIDLFPAGNWRVRIGGEAEIVRRGPVHFLEAENFYNDGLTVPVEPTATGPWLYQGFVLPVLDRLELLSTLEAFDGNGYMDVGSLELEYLGSYIDGDWNFNGKVDAADYVMWRKELGKHRTLADLRATDRNFGEVAPNPEPNTLALLWIATWFGCRLAPTRWR